MRDLGLVAGSRCRTFLLNHDGDGGTKDVREDGGMEFPPKKKDGDEVRVEGSTSSYVMVGGSYLKAEGAE